VKNQPIFPVGTPEAKEVFRPLNTEKEPAKTVGL